MRTVVGPIIPKEVCEIGLPEDFRSSEMVEVIRSAEALRRLRVALGRDPELRQQMRRLLAAADPCCAVTTMRDDDVVREVVERVRRGGLWMATCRPIHRQVQGRAHPVASAPPPTKKTTSGSRLAAQPSSAPVHGATALGRSGSRNQPLQLGDLDLVMRLLHGGPEPRGKARLRTEQGEVATEVQLAGGARDHEIRTVTFHHVRAGQRYDLEIETTAGTRYRVLTRTVASADLRVGRSVGRPLEIHAVRVVFEDEPSQPVATRSVDVELGGRRLTLGTDAGGALVASPPRSGSRPPRSAGRRSGMAARRVALAGPLTVRRPMVRSSDEPVWLDPACRALRVACGRDALATTGPAPQARREDVAVEDLEGRAGVVEKTARVPRIRIALPIHATFTTVADAQRFLARHPLRVDINGAAVACGVAVVSADLVRVEFPVEPGTHRVIVTSQETESQGMILPRRTIYFAREVTVGWPGSAVESGGPSGGGSGERARAQSTRHMERG